MAVGDGFRMLNRAWRSLVTATCFIAFGIGGTVLSAIFFPLLMIAPAKGRQKHARSRTVIGFFFRLLVRVLQKSGCMRLETSGLERLDGTRGALVLANHPSYIDVVVLLSLAPQVNCVVKGALWRNPFYWSIVRSAGYLRNSTPESLVESCAKALTAGESLVLFPEGTRTVPGQPPRFQRGAAHVALKANATVMPVFITCTPSTLAKGDPWWLAPKQPFTFQVAVQEAVPITFFVPDPDNSAIGARRFTDALQQYFSRELKSYGYA